MKKIVLGIMLFAVVLLTTGCGEQREMVCTVERPIDGISLSSSYKATYKNGIVSKVNSHEEIISDNKEILNEIATAVKKTYDTMNQTYGGYDFDIIIEDNKIISDVLIDYTKMNLKKLKEDEPKASKYINNKNEVTIQGLKSMYEDKESVGATCELK